MTALDASIGASTCLVTRSSVHSNPATLRDRIAAVAARLIAEDGLDYAGAKRRALREVTGDARRVDRDCLPDNAQVEAAVRDHQSLFMSETQPARLLRLRLCAIDVMRFLADDGAGVDCYATGAVVNGTAGEHSDVHLLVFNDNAKDLEIFLLNAGVDFEVSEGSGSRADRGETLYFLWPRRPGRNGDRSAIDREAVHLTVLDPRDQRLASGTARADLRALGDLIAASRQVRPTPGSPGSDPA